MKTNLLLILIKWTEFGAVRVAIYYISYICVAFLTVLKVLGMARAKRKSEGGARYMKS